MATWLIALVAFFIAVKAAAWGLMVWLVARQPDDWWDS